MYGIEREPRTERRPSAPRAIARSLAEGVKRTPRASELTEAGPETNNPGRAKGTAVESTVAYPGGPAVVREPALIAGHTDDDARLDADGELIEPAATEQPGEGARDEQPEGERKPEDEQPEGGESMTSERVGVAREASPSTDGTAAGTNPPAKRAPGRKGPTGS